MGRRKDGEFIDKNILHYSSKPLQITRHWCIEIFLYLASTGILSSCFPIPNIQHYFYRLYGKIRDMNIDFYLRDVAFFDGTCYSCAQCSVGGMNCSENFDFLIDKVLCHTSRPLLEFIRQVCYQVFEKWIEFIIHF